MTVLKDTIEKLKSWKRNDYVALYDKEMRSLVSDALVILEEYQKNYPNVLRWIPVKTELPRNDDFVLVTVLDETGDTSFLYTDVGWYFDRAKCWIVEACERNNVIAWMPFPESYEPMRGEKEND